MRTLASNLKGIIALLAVAAGASTLLLSPSLLSPMELKISAIGIIVITFWATGVIPEHLTALLFFLIAMLFSVAPPGVIFSGFQSGAFWLVFGGLVMGLGINRTGLGKRIAGKMAVYLGGSYTKLIYGMVITGVLFGFLMPSAMGRVVLLIPITIAVTGHCGFKNGSNGYIGVVLAIVLGSFFPAFSILPSNVANMILVGMTESLYQYTPLYGEYLLLHFPVLGLLKAVLIAGLIPWLYPDQPTPDKKKSLESGNSISNDEKLLSAVLLVMLLLWVTDFIHHTSPAWIALAGALFLLMPKIEIVSKQQFNEMINYNSLFFIAGILGLGSTVSHTGLGSTLAKHLISLLPFDTGTPFINYMSLGISSMLTGIITTLPGVPAVLTPLSGDLAQASGFPLRTVFMTQVLGFSIAIFPYQAPPILVGMQLAGVKLREALRVCALLGLISIMLLLPLNYLWWKVLGWL